jgi:plastocyanin
LAAGLAAALLTGACGTERPHQAPALVQPPGSIRITMTDYRFTPETVSAPSGDIVLFLVNSGTAGHDLTLLGAGGKRLAGSKLEPTGGAESLALKALPAGRYRFFCSQPGHEDLGMTGELQVV